MDRKGIWINELEQPSLSPELERLETIEARADNDVVALEHEKNWTHEF